MTLIQAIFLGVLQGATEFIPVSSSGHLVVVPWLLDWPDPGLVFDAVVHWGTALAVLAVFWRDLYRLLLAGDELVDHPLTSRRRRRRYRAFVGPLGDIGILTLVPT